MTTRFALGLYFALFLLFTLERASAATIRPSESNACNIELSGRIERGDAEQLNQLLEEEPRARTIGKLEIVRNDICLNSEEGDFEEALFIVQKLIEISVGWGSVGTVVDKGAKCIGPCALIFMAGRFHAFHGVTFPQRQLHVDGRLVFRNISTAPDTTNDMAVAYAKAVKLTAQIFKQNVVAGDMLDRNRPFAKSLVQAILKLGPNDSLAVETLDQANNWQITLKDVPAPRALTLGMLWTACANYQAGWGFARPNLSAGSVEEAITLKDRLWRQTFKGFGKNQKEFCIADIYDSPKHGLVLNLETRQSLNPKPDEFISTPQSNKEFIDNEDGRDFGRQGRLGEPLWLMYLHTTKIGALGSAVQ